MNSNKVQFSGSFESPLGRFYIVSDGESIQEITPSLKGSQILSDENHILIKKAKTQLKEYFAGKRTKFDLPLNPEGTDFQKKAWRELQKIPYGKTVSYADQAKKLGGANKCRAVGSANGKNPLPILIPCHRVINKNGKLGGFAWGLDVKTKLLELEGAL